MRLTELLDTLKLAAQALKRLPPERLPADTRSHWPAIIHDQRDAYGYETATYSRLPPTVEQVTALDKVCGWLWAIEPAQRRLVMARAGGMSWRRIMRQRRRSGDGIRHASLRVEFRGACLKLWAEAKRETSVKPLRKAG